MQDKQPWMVTDSFVVCSTVKECLYVDGITLTVSFSHAALWWKPASRRLVHALQERPPVDDASTSLQHIPGRRVRDLQRRPVSHHRAPSNSRGFCLQFQFFLKYNLEDMSLG